MQTKSSSKNSSPKAPARFEDFDDGRNFGVRKAKSANIEEDNFEPSGPSPDGAHFRDEDTKEHNSMAPSGGRSSQNRTRSQ